MKFSDEAECGYTIKWRELQWSMLWHRPGGKYKNNSKALIPKIIQIWDLKQEIHKTPGCVTTCRANLSTKYL